MKKFISGFFVLIVFLFTGINNLNAQNAEFEWWTEFCQFKGKYDTTEVTEA